jgi:hypothetical protein
MFHFNLQVLHQTIVLFKNMPNQTYHTDISFIVNPVIKGGIFRKKGALNNLEILALKEIHTGLLEFQALAYIEPEEAANRVIKTLNGLYLKGSRVTVRKYFLQDWKKDKMKWGKRYGLAISRKTHKSYPSQKPKSL